MKKYLFLLFITIVADDVLSAAALPTETGIRGLFSRASRVLRCCRQPVVVAPSDHDDTESTTPPILTITTDSPFSDASLARDSLATDRSSIAEAGPLYSQVNKLLLIWVECNKEIEAMKLKPKTLQHIDFHTVAKEESDAANQINNLAMKLSTDEAKKLYTQVSFNSKAPTSLLILKIKAKR